jgi:peroxiredoxin
MERSSVSERFAIGSELPHFSLPSVDGSVVTDQFFSGAAASLVVFTCNHCPYVKGSEAMLNTIVKRFIPEGLKVVAISSNDSVQYPDDGFAQMKEKAVREQLPYPYLYDESQAVAKAFDAACTPEIYLFDRSHKLVFHGTVNDSPRDPSKVSKEYLSDAISAVIAGEVPPQQFVHAIGCSIKWKAD